MICEGCFVKCLKLYRHRPVSPGWMQRTRLLDSLVDSCQKRHDEGSAVAPQGHVNSTPLGTVTIQGYGLLSCSLLTDPVPPQGNDPISMEMKYCSNKMSVKRDVYVRLLHIVHVWEVIL